MLNSFQVNRYSPKKPISYNYFVPNIGISSDTFTKNPSFTAKPFTIDWYKTLTPDKIDIFNKRADQYIYHNKEWLFYDKNFNKHLHYHDIIATGIKNALNDKFGADNYIVIPIGRSVSSICKCLGYKIGEDRIKPLPMSSARRFVDLENCKENFKLLTQYLKSIGLSKRDIKTTDKKYVFIDYCNSGRSLHGVKILFESNKVWGQQDNVYFEDIIKLLSRRKRNLAYDKIFPKKFLKDLEEEFLVSRYKRYALVKDCPRFHYLKDAVLQPEDYNYERQVFYWKLLDNEIKKQINSEGQIFAPNISKVTF